MRCWRPGGCRREGSGRERRALGGQEDVLSAGWDAEDRGKEMVPFRFWHRFVPYLGFPSTNLDLA